MSRPLIGINCDTAHRPSGEKRLALNVSYARAVEDAGGVPVLLPWQSARSLGRALDRLDGLLLSGGDDLDPRAYGLRPHPAETRMDPERQAFDLALARQALGRRLPTLGVCGGCQLLNVVRGGSLVQDIPSQVAGALAHGGPDRPRPWHPVFVAPDSRLHRILGRETLEANSFHHQAVGGLGRGLSVSAAASDGVVEGIEDGSLPFLVAVQWHPERCYRERPLHRRLFKALVEAASKA